MLVRPRNESLSPDGRGFGQYKRNGLVSRGIFSGLGPELEDDLERYNTTNESNSSNDTDAPFNLTPDEAAGAMIASRYQ